MTGQRRGRPPRPVLSDANANEGTKMNAFTKFASDKAALETARQASAASARFEDLYLSEGEKWAHDYELSAAASDAAWAECRRLGICR